MLPAPLGAGSITDTTYRITNEGILQMEEVDMSSKSYKDERAAGLSCDNVLCAYHDYHSSQNRCASYATHHDPPESCDDYRPLKK